MPSAPATVKRTVTKKVRNTEKGKAPSKKKGGYKHGNRS